MNDIQELDKKQAQLAEVASTEADVAHHRREVQSYIANKFIDDLQHLEMDVDGANDPELTMKLMNLKMKIAGWDSVKQDQSKDQVILNINIDLSDGPAAGFTVAATPIKQNVVDVSAITVDDTDAPEVKMPFSSFDMDAL